MDEKKYEKSEKKNGRLGMIVAAILVVVIILLLLLLKGCNGKKKLQIKVSDIGVGAGESVAVSVLDDEMISKGYKVSYKIKDPSIAEVDKDGVVTGKKDGKTTLEVTVTAPDGDTEVVEVPVIVGTGEEGEDPETGDEPGDTDTSGEDDTSITEPESGEGNLDVTDDPAGDEDPESGDDSEGEDPESGDDGDTSASSADNGEKAEAPAHSHKYTSAVTKNATCSETGTTTYTCSCGDSYTEIIPATGNHKFSVLRDTAATCTSDGLYIEECSECRLQKKGSDRPATGHRMSGWDNMDVRRSGTVHHRKCLNGCGLSEEQGCDCTGGHTCPICGYQVIY